MMTDFKNKTAVLTGAGSGFGLECARIGARLGINLVLVDVQQDALDRAEQELPGRKTTALAHPAFVDLDAPNGAVFFGGGGHGQALSTTRR